MKFSIFIMLLFSYSVLVSQEDYKTQIENYRAKKDLELQSRKTSPLKRKDRKQFQDLPYFDIYESWKFDVELRKTSNSDIIEIPTSAGYAKKFKEYGILEIYVDDKYVPLTAFVRIPRDGEEPPQHPSLFVPFKDLTSGNSTYGGGRYLDIPLPKEGSVATVDFNLAYSPYCAYGEGFACPIPPVQNFIKAEVTAGEKAIVGH